MTYLVFMIALPIITIFGCICAKNKIIKVLLGVLSGIIIFILIIWLLLVYAMNYAITDVDSKTSGDGTHSVILQSVGSPIFFSAADGRFVLKEGNKTVIKYKFTLHDDGGVIRSSIWDVEWQSDSVSIIVSGSEQADQLYELYFDGHVEETQLDTSSDQIIATENESKSESRVEQEVDEDEDGYPLTDEFQAYKRQIAAIVTYIAEEDSTGYQCDYFINAKGRPYAVIFRDTQTVNGTTVNIEQRLVYNESYVDEKTQEYVYEEFYLNEDGSEAQSVKILDFYLVDTETLDVTDENRTSWSE
jgi:hypothetical protein